MTVQTITHVVNKTRLFPPVDKTTTQPPTPDKLSPPLKPDNLEQIALSEDRDLSDALKSSARQKLPPICWDDTMWRENRFLYASSYRFV